MNNSLSSVAAEVRISPMWVVIPLAALGVPTIFIIKLLWGALELKMVLFFLLFYGVLGVTWLLINRNDVGGKWFFVIASTVMIWIGYSGGETQELLTLMVVPPVIGAVLIDLPAAPKGVAPRNLDVRELQQTLVENGASIRRDPEKVAFQYHRAAEAVQKALENGDVTGLHMAPQSHEELAVPQRAPRL
ncbi:MAG: hypothetical protein KDJ65_10090 [Anaerolineae bacterium]|nr:hypothetical protein [Anaerolineae bacterium]